MNSTNAKIQVKKRSQSVDSGLREMQIGKRGQFNYRELAARNFLPKFSTETARNFPPKSRAPVGSKTYVMISYCHKQQKLVKKMNNILRKNGFKTWIDYADLGKYLPI